MRGCVALTRGPIVYCIEQADHPEAVAVEDLLLHPESPPEPGEANADLGVPVTLVGPAIVETAAQDELTRVFDAQPSVRSTAATLTAIPYYRWANRGPNPMRVWIPTA